MAKKKQIKKDLLLCNGIVITLGDNNKIIDNGAVLISGDVIKDIGKTDTLKKKYKTVQVMDVKGKLIMPGYINSHMHLYSTFARGLGKAAPSKNFTQILKNLWWRLDKKLEQDDIYYSSLVPLIECIKNGTTTMIDHHASPYSITGSLQNIAKATTKAGIRSCLCYEVSDRDGKKITDEGIEENLNFIKYCKKEKNDLLQGLFGLHASFTVSAKTLEKSVQAIKDLNSGFHVHTAEDKSDVVASQKKYKCGVVERWAKTGVLGPKTILAHCIHISEKEQNLIKKTDTIAVHNPQSNMNNAVGVADVLKMLKKGILMGLGTDGMTSRMQEEVRIAYLLHRIANLNPQVGFMEAPQMLLNNNAKIASRLFGKKIGVLEKGQKADVIVVDYTAPTPLDGNTFLGHYLFGIYQAPVLTTICNGKVLMLNGKLKTLNESKICEVSRELSAKFWDRF